MRSVDAMPQGASPKGRGSLLGVAAALSLLATLPCRAGEVRYFDAESSVNNHASLKSGFDGYLSARGPYSFRPYPSRSDFEQTVPGAPGDIVMMSGWHFRRLRSSRPLEAVLVGVNKNQTMIKKILCMKKDAQTLAILPGRPIAGAASEAFMRNMLLAMVGKEQRPLIEAARVLVVPKDIDALMAVGYGMATAAFVSEKSFDLLQRINPTLAGQLTAVARSEEILRLIVAARPGYDASVTKFLDVVAGMEHTPDGERDLQLLGLDGWRRLGDAEQRALRP